MRHAISNHDASPREEIKNVRNRSLPSASQIRHTNRHEAKAFHTRTRADAPTPGNHPANRTPAATRGKRDAAEVAYFTAKGTPERLDKLLVLDVTELLEINYQRVDTPEASELHSIGLAVAAFGGCDAISEIGRMLANRGCRDAQFIWSRWDGMAGHGSSLPRLWRADGGRRIGRLFCVPVRPPILPTVTH